MAGCLQLWFLLSGLPQLLRFWFIFAPPVYAHVRHISSLGAAALLCPLEMSPFNFWHCSSLSLPNPSTAGNPQPPGLLSCIAGPVIASQGRFLGAGLVGSRSRKEEWMVSAHSGSFSARTTPVSSYPLTWRPHFATNQSLAGEEMPWEAD